MVQSLRSWRPCSKEPVSFPRPRLCVTFRNMLLFLRRGDACNPPNPQACGPPLFGCPRLLIQHIRSYPAYLVAVSSTCNLRTRHAVVTRNTLNTVSFRLLWAPSERCVTDPFTRSPVQVATAVSELSPNWLIRHYGCKQLTVIRCGAANKWAGTHSRLLWYSVSHY
jgi:hypothetical protein